MRTEWIFEETEWMMKQMQQKEFENANKPGKLLAWQLKKRREKKYITKIIDKGMELINQQAIK